MSNYNNHTGIGTGTATTKYEPLAFDDGGPSTVPSSSASIPPALRNRSNRARRCCSFTFSNNLRPLIWLSILTNAMLAGWTGWFSYQRLHRLPWKGVKPIYNPVDEAVRYEHRIFPKPTDRTIYHGPPTPDVDRAWDDLYVPYGISLVTGEQAKRLSRETAPEPDLDDRYKISIEVTHQIHCLNFLRVMAWPEIYSNAASGRFALVAGQVVDHADHCLNAMRETLMCQADVTPMVWRTITSPTSTSHQHNHQHHRRHEGGHENAEQMSLPPSAEPKVPASGESESIAQYNVVHTCRSYSHIQKWAGKHAMPRPLGPDRFNESLPHHLTPNRKQLLDSGLLVGVEF